MNARLIYTISGTQREIRLRKPIMTVGRKRDCDICVPAGPVSRQHCQIIQRDNVLFVKDLGSANGTRVNGTAVTEQMLSPGDLLQVGPVTFRVQYDLTGPKPITPEPVEAIPVDIEPLEAVPVDAEPVEAIPVEAVAVPAADADTPAPAEPVQPIPLDHPGNRDAPIPMAGSNIFDEDEAAPASDLFAPEGVPTRLGGPGAPGGAQPSPEQPQAQDVVPVEPTPVEGQKAVPADAFGAVAPDAPGEQQDAELAEFLARMGGGQDEEPVIELDLDEEPPAEDQPQKK